MASVQDLRLDAEEVQKFLDTATRQRVKDCLTVELKKIETQINLKPMQNIPTETKTVKTGQRVLPIKTYAWDQSNKFMKIYVTVNGVQNVPNEQVTCSFGDRSFHLKCDGVKDKNYECLVNTLLEEIIPGESYHKVKTDTVLVMLKKKDESTWAFVTDKEKKVKDKSKDKNDMSGMSDPQDGMMTMMKKMYEEGDDDMKRQIAKAWTESNDKKKLGGAGDMF